MIRNSSRRARLFSWRYLRWAIALPTLPMVWWACISHPLTQPVPEPEQQSDIYITVSPVRKLDLVFMVDNSPSMAPKVDKMNKQFTQLLAALKDQDGQYPDMRVAVVDSDLGTGGQYNNGNPCSPNAWNNQNPYGDLGTFQMRGKSGAANKGTDCGMSDDNSLWIETSKGAPLNYKGGADAINSVFACLATDLGTNGCGEEHQLQAYEFAFFAGSYHTDAQNNFIRPEAYLGLVFLSDEDDCSAATDDGMFGDQQHPELRGESASLRCASRGHACKINGNMTNLADGGPHYPTDTAFQTDFLSCSARTDSCSNALDQGQQGTNTTDKTSCTPLRSIRTMADKIKGIKGAQADEKILVAGIFGWPLADDKGDPDFANAEKYKIDKVPNQNKADTAHPEVWDYWPLCYDPDNRPAVAGQYDEKAWGMGAEGGLRMSAFIDEFKANGLKYSICERDFSKAMEGIGTAIAKKLSNLCVSEKLYNNAYKSTPAPATPDDLGADCRVAFSRPVTNGTTITYVPDKNAMPKCAPGAQNGHVDQDCWKLVIDKDKCTDNGQLISVLRTQPEIDKDPTIPEGTKVNMQCRTCPDDTTVQSLDHSSETFQACSYPPFK
jgi:hypothetical protein